MKSGRIVSGSLFAVWLLLSIAPAGIALQNDQCLVCNQKSCPMKKKMEHPSCHEDKKPVLKFEACNCKHNTFVFTYNAVIPDVNFDSHKFIALLSERVLSFQSFLNPQNDTPPPKTLAA
jgi:hypothetical protein